MKLGLNVGKLKNFFRRQNLRRCFFDFFSGVEFKILVFVIAVLASGYCVYIWYNFVYEPGWSDSRKREYIINKDKGAVFNRTRFKEIVAEIESRKARFGERIENSEDIFRIKK